ncbi:hypothetical protein N9V90_00195 [Endozoicomonas sp.]|nr:hypothetical protein [Endozoicomonas sp.]
MLFSGKKPFGKLVYTLEALALFALVFLEYLSVYKGGLMKHLDYKKMEYMFSWFTPSAVVIHTFVVLGLLIYSFVWISRGERCHYAIRCGGRALIYTIALLTAFYNPWIQERVVYPYLLMVMETLFIVEVVKIVLSKSALARKRSVINEQSNAVTNHCVSC